MDDNPLEGPNQPVTSSAASNAQSDGLGIASTSSQTYTEKDRVELTPMEVLQNIRNGVPDVNQALAILSHFWALFSTSHPIQRPIYDCYRALRQRQLEATRHHAEGDSTPSAQPDLTSHLIALGTTSMTRFQQLGDQADIQTAIDCFFDAIPSFPDGHPAKPVVLSNLGNALMWRFERHGDVGDINEAVSCQRRAISLTPDNHPYLLLRLRSLGVSLRLRYRQGEDPEDLEQAISAIRQAVSLASDDHPELCTWLNEYGNLLLDRFKRLDQLGDLDEAQSSFERAALLAPPAGADRSRHFGNLADMFEARFKRLGEISDLDAAISHRQATAELIPDGHFNKPLMLTRLANSIFRRFEILGELVDVNRAIAHQERALALSPEGHSNIAFILNELGVFLVSKFEHNGDPASLERAIAAQKEAVSLLPGDSISRPSFLSNLGTSLMRRFEFLDELADAEQAASVHELALSLTPDGHEEQPKRLNNLGTLLLRRFERLDQPADLDNGIANVELAVLLTSDEHPQKTMWLNNLGTSLYIRFNRMGRLLDLDQAISYQNRAIELGTRSHPNKPSWLNNLGTSLLSRFERIGDQADLDNAIANHRLGVSLTQRGRSILPMLLTSLGNALRVRFELLRHYPDIQEATSSHEQVVSLTSDDHAARAARLSNLGNSLLDLYTYSNEPRDLEKAISTYRLAVQLTSDNHPQLAIWLNHLGKSLADRFVLLKELPDIDEAIEMQQRAVSLIPDDRPAKSLVLWDLSFSFSLRFNHTKSPPDIYQALHASHASATSSAGRPAVRYNAARNMASWAASIRSPLALSAYRLAMDLVPAVIWLGKTPSGRYQSISQIGQLPTDAAAQAIESNQYYLALEWLEEGRSMIWNQILQLRTPFDELRQVDAALADRLEEVAHALDDTGTERPTDSATSLSTNSLEDAAQKQHRMAEEWASLLERTRAIPQFSDFLMPRKIAELIRGTHRGTIVVVNVSRTRCDALVLLDRYTEVIHVPLPAFSWQAAAEMKTQWSQSLRSAHVRARGFKVSAAGSAGAAPKFRHILATLWSDVVQPILERIDYLKPNTETDELPRIIWCTTGPLAFLPLHAAGFYDGNRPQPKIFDYVVSSYTPTLASLLAPEPGPDTFHGILVVGQAATPGKAPLPGTVRELDCIQRQVGHIRPFTRLEGENATVDAVLHAMDQHTWVHLACHASQNLYNPTTSAFYLHDGPLDLAAISKRGLKHAGLAFLSACETAAGDEKLQEEAVHLAAGMMMSGYPGVIATMWSIKDDHAVLVADRVYSNLAARKANGNAARALHEAVGCLRLEIGEDQFDSWVPFIHFGL